MAEFTTWIKLDELRQRVEPLLESLEENLADLIEALTNPIPHRSPFKRLAPPRYTEAEIPGASELLLTIARAVAPMLNDESWIRRNTILSILQLAPAPELAGAVSALTSDDNRIIQIKAVDVLGLMDAEEYADDVSALLESDDDQVRLSAVTTLGMWDDEECAPVLREVLVNDSNDGVRGYAAKALGLLGGKENLEALIEAHSEAPTGFGKEQIQAAIAHIAVSEEWIDVALDDWMLRFDPLFQLRLDGAKAFAGSSESVDQLIGHLEDDDLRDFAAFELARVGDATGLLRLLELFENPLSRGEVQRLLGEISPEAAAAAAISMLGEKPPARIIQRACESAATHGWTDLFPTILDLIEGADLPVASVAAVALARVEHPQSVAKLRERWAREPSPESRHDVVFELHQEFRPIPLTVIDVFLDDPCAPIVTVALDLLEQDYMEWDVQPRIQSLLRREVRRLKGDQASRDPSQNHMLKSDAYLSVVGQRISQLPEIITRPFEDELTELEAASWSDPSEAVARAALRIAKAEESDAEAVFGPWLLVDRPMVKFDAMAYAFAYAEDTVFKWAPDLSTDPCPLVRFFWLANRVEWGHNEKSALALVMQDPAPSARRGAITLLENLGRSGKAGLKKLAADPDPQVSLLAKEALDQL